MTDWREVRTCATERDECERCAHAATAPYGGGTLLMCREASALRAFGRDEIAASVARADWCDGKQWATR